MTIFDFLNIPDINKGIQDYKESVGAILLDVRSEREYSNGHIADSRNIPVKRLDKVARLTDNKDTPIFVYCHSGSRSRQAANVLISMGYTNVKDIGGIIAYSGKVEK